MLKKRGGYQEESTTFRTDDLRKFNHWVTLMVRLAGVTEWEG